MDVFTKLFGEFLVFVYHCFDRIVIHGYLTALSRPELVVHFFRDIVGVAEVSKEVLSQRTNDYQRWVEAYARNHSIPIEWAEKGVRKEDHVLPWLHRMARRDAYGVYFIFKSMEQGPTYRVSLPKYPSKDPHYRILAHRRSRFTHYYFYIRDEVLGPMVLLVASFFPFQTAYYLNGHSFIEQELRWAGIGFRKHDNAFLAVADPAALQAAADRLSPDIIRRRLDYWTLILGPKFSKKERAQLNLSRLYFDDENGRCSGFEVRRRCRSSAQFTPRSTTISIRSAISSPAECTSRDALPHWRSGAPLQRRSSLARGHVALRVDEATPLGLLVAQKIGVSLDDVVRHAPADAPRDGSKLALILDLLRRADGATIVDLTQATGWLAHTTRAAITGLRPIPKLRFHDRRRARDSRACR